MSDKNLENDVQMNVDSAMSTEEKAKAKYKKAQMFNVCIIVGLILAVFGYYQFTAWEEKSNLDYIEGNVLKLARTGVASVGTSWKNASVVGQLCNAGVFSTDATFTEVNPDLAEKYDVSDDGLTYTITMKDNLKWSDGTPLTVNDFKWSIEAFMKAASVNSTISSAFNTIEGVEEFIAEENPADSISGLTIDGNKLIIKLERPYNSFPLVLTQFVILPEHALKDEVGPDILTSDFFKTVELSVTSGMYRMDAINADGDLELVHNEHYYGEHSDIERVILYGDYQNMHIDQYSTSNISEMISYRSMTGFEEYNVDVNFYRYFVFNQAAAYDPPAIVEKVDDNGNPVLDENGNVIMEESTEPNEYPADRGPNEVMQDIRVRQAITHAIDVDALIKDVYYGTAQVNYGGATGLAEKVYEYNPTKAKQLLEEAEYDFDYNFTIVYYHTDPNTLVFLDRVKQYLEDIGMKVTLKRASGNTNLYEVREYDMFLKALSAFNVEDWYGEYLSNNNNLYGVIGTDIFDEKLEQLYASGANPNEYKALLQELVDLEQEHLFKMPMLTLDDAVYINANRLSVPEDITFGNTRYRSDLRVDEWYIKKG